MPDVRARIFRDAIFNIMETLSELRKDASVEVRTSMRKLHIPREVFFATRSVYETLTGSDGHKNIRTFLDALYDGMKSPEVAKKAASLDITLPEDYFEGFREEFHHLFAKFASVIDLSRSGDGHDALVVLASFSEYCVHMLFAEEFNDERMITVCQDGSLVVDGQGCGTVNTSARFISKAVRGINNIGSASASSISTPQTTTGTVSSTGTGGFSNLSPTVKKLPVITCWDGSKVTNQSLCPADTRVRCWDGTKEATTALCPPDTRVRCWDGSKAATTALCPPDTRVACWDGSKAATTALCPPDTRVACWDGSKAATMALCPPDTRQQSAPAQSAPTFVCADGSTVSDPSHCPRAPTKSSEEEQSSSDNSMMFIVVLLIAAAVVGSLMLTQAKLIS